MSRFVLLDEISGSFKEKEVFKHGSHNQKTHGQRGGASDLPEGWSKRSDEERMQEVIDRARNDWGGSAPEENLRSFAEMAIKNTDQYDGPNGTRLNVRTDVGIPQADVDELIGHINTLQAIAPVDGLTVTVSDGAFDALNMPPGVKGYNIRGTTEIMLRPTAIREGVNNESGRLMGSGKGYSIVHEYGHVLDRRSEERALEDWRDLMYTPNMDGMSRYAQVDRYEAFAEAWTGWVLSTGQSKAPFVRYFADRHGWDAGGEGRPPSAGFAKARGLIIADTFDDEGPIHISIDDERVEPTVIKFAPGLRPALKHLGGKHDQASHAGRGRAGAAIDRFLGPDFAAIERERENRAYISGQTMTPPSWTGPAPTVYVPSRSIRERIQSARKSIRDWRAKREHERMMAMTPAEVDRVSRANRRRADAKRAAQGKPPLYEDFEKHGSHDQSSHGRRGAGRSQSQEIGGAADTNVGFAGLTAATGKWVAQEAADRGVNVRDVEKEFERRIEVARTMPDPYRPGMTAYEGGLDWYSGEAHSHAVAVGRGDAARGAAIISALSPQNPWPANKNAATAVADLADRRDELGLDSSDKAWAKFKEVHKDYGNTGPVTKPAFDQAWAVANGADINTTLTGRKRRNFHNNILGDAESVTVDVHMMKALSTTPTSTIRGKKEAEKFWQWSKDNTKSATKRGVPVVAVDGVGYTIAAQATINVARRMGLEPRQVQAIVWNTCVTEKWAKPPVSTEGSE